MRLDLLFRCENNRDLLLNDFNMGKIHNHPTNIIHHFCPKPLQAQHLHPLYRHSAPESIGCLRDTFAKSSSHKSL